ncbi:hypothetical protein ACK323_03965 [Aeromonas enteropelogenes]|uniref:hypothetical protein n=1 Tax=Aeromonas enteropelogenes TaxID=29489 RepID=UPI003989E821
MSTGTKIHIGTIGMGIPPIYRDVVSKIFSYHLATEATLAKYIEKHSLKPKKNQFSSRLISVEERGEFSDWVIEACRKLNRVRNKCVHIESAEYQNIHIRIEALVEELVLYVSQYNIRHEQHKMSNFDWACTLIYQRLYELLELEYDPLILGDIGSKPKLPSSLAVHFFPLS